MTMSDEYEKIQFACHENIAYVYSIQHTNILTDFSSQKNITS